MGFRAVELRIAIIATLFGICSIGCGPIKGYRGPELPPEQIARVKIQEPIWNLRVNSHDVGGAGIDLLPGTSYFEIIRLWKVKNNCLRTSEFDTYGYDNCRDEREDHIREGRYASSCYTSTYTNYYTYCDVDNSEYLCTGDVKLVANEQYTVKDLDGPKGPIQVAGIRTKPAKVPCRFTRSWSAREKQ